MFLFTFPSIPGQPRPVVLLHIFTPLQGIEANLFGASHKRKESGQVAATKRFGKFQQLIGLLVLAAVFVQAIPPTMVADAAPLPQSTPAPALQSGVVEYPFGQGYQSWVNYEYNMRLVLDRIGGGNTYWKIPANSTESYNSKGCWCDSQGFKVAAGVIGGGACDVATWFYHVAENSGQLTPWSGELTHSKIYGVPLPAVNIWTGRSSADLTITNNNPYDLYIHWDLNSNPGYIRLWVDQTPGSSAPSGSVVQPSTQPVQPQQSQEPPSGDPVGSPLDVYTISPLGVRQGCELEGGCDNMTQSGIDLIGYTGQPIQSTINGIVTDVGLDSQGNSYVQIESASWIEVHRHGKYTVTVGQELRQGDQIGTVDQIGIEEQALPMEFFSLFDKATGQNLQNVEQYQEVFARQPKWWIFNVPGNTPSIEVTLSPERKSEVVDWWNQVLAQAQALATPTPSPNSTEIIQTENGRIVVGHLDQGARIEATGSNTPVDLKTHLAELGQYGVCVANGSYWEPGGALSFPYIKNGTLITKGAIPTDGWNIRVLYVNGSEAFVSGTIDLGYQGDMLVGLVPDRTEVESGVTLVGVKGRDVYFSVTNGTVAQAVDDLVARGVLEDQIVMFDGGGSRQLLCADGTSIAPDTQIPQGVGIVAGTDVASWFTQPLPEDNWAPVDETAFVNSKAPKMRTDVVETTYPSGIAVHHSTGALMGDWFDQTLGVHLGEDRVTYNMVISGDGVAHLTSKFGAASYHARCFDDNTPGQCPNWDYFSIVLTGNFMTDQPTPAQLATLEKAIRWAISNGAAPTVLGHRDIAQTLGSNSYTTECPGDSLYIQLPDIVRRATTPEMPIAVPLVNANLTANNILIIIAFVLTLVIALIIWTVVMALKPELRWRQYYKEPKPMKEPSAVNKKLWLFFKIYGVIWVIIITAHRAWLARYALWSVLPDPSEGFEIRLWVPGYMLYLLPVTLLIAVLIRAAKRVSFKQRRVLLPEAPVRPPSKAEIRKMRRWRVFRVVSIILIIVLLMYVFGGALTFAFGARPTAPAPTPIPMEEADGQMQDIPAFFKTEVRSLAVQVNQIAMEENVPTAALFTLWLKESGGRRVNPNNGEGLCGFYSRVKGGIDYFQPGAISEAELLRQLRLCAQEFRKHADRAEVGSQLSYDTTSFDVLGPTYMVYNGNIDCHGNAFASWRDHPYVMNGYDEDHDGMVARDGKGGCVSLKIIGAVPAHIRINALLLEVLAPAATATPSTPAP